MATTPYQYDRERVVTSQLARVLEQWCEASGEDNPIHRMSLLCEVDLRTLYAIRQKRTKSTSYYLADKILTKIGMGEALKDGRIMKPGQHSVYHKSAVDCSTVRPHTKELVKRCGGAPQAAEYALVAPQTLNRILGESQCRIQQATARKILIALEHRREEDIEIKKIHDRLLRKRQKDARENERS